jgi:hypothetical protein
LISLFIAWKYFSILFHYSNTEENVELEVFSLFLPLLSAQTVLIDVVMANISLLQMIYQGYFAL